MFLHGRSVLPSAPKCKNMRFFDMFDSSEDLYGLSNSGKINTCTCAKKEEKTLREKKSSQLHSFWKTLMAVVTIESYWSSGSSQSKSYTVTLLGFDDILLTNLPGMHGLLLAFVGIGANQWLPLISKTLYLSQDAMLVKYNDVSLFLQASMILRGHRVYLLLREKDIFFFFVEVMMVFSAFTFIELEMTPDRMTV